MPRAYVAASTLASPVRLRLALAALVIAALPGCGGSRPAPPPPARPPVVVRPPAPPAPSPPVAVAPVTIAPGVLPGPSREFRATWIATVANIDWPTRSDLTTAQQQAELTTLLDRVQAVGMNAVVLQVRTTADAFYDSPLEPWSEYLTGRQGRAPQPYYDPLAFAVEAAHARGIELHAWINPYRAGHPTEDGPRAATHVSRTIPDAVVRYGDYLWLDPGSPEATDHTMAVIRDLVTRYDLDGIHLDDYFYPYPQGGRPFPDDASYRRARDAGETLGKNDWRRQNVDRFIERLYTEVKGLKPWVKVGISPFGIWRPGHPAGVTGMDAVATIHADARRWQQEGWLDYLAPQLYWAIGSRNQSFPALLRWWGEQNSAGRHLWPGLYDSRILPDVGGYTIGEIEDQTRLVREDAVATGTIHFSAKTLAPRWGLGELLGGDLYAAPALVPASPWLDAEPPPAPSGRLVETPDGLAVSFAPAPGSEPVRRWIVRERRGTAWTWSLVAPDAMAHPLGRVGGMLPEAVAVAGVDRVGNEGASLLLEVPMR